MQNIKRLLKSLGPGFITGAADDDPAGIATYSQTGAQFGYSQAWTALFSFPFMSAVQEMCGRIGLVTGKGLSANIKAHYSKPVLYISVVLLMIANTINIGADLGAMASAITLVLPGSFEIWLLGITAFSLILEIVVSYKVYARFLKYLTFSLLSYIVTALLIKQDWGHVVYATLVPSFSLSKEYIFNIVAILGTTISPYLFFWQANEEVEEELVSGKLTDLGQKPTITKLDIRNMRLDTLLGMFFSNIVMFFIIITCAATLGANGITQIDSPAQAAQALRPIAGDFAFLLFTLGIVGTGLLAIPVLAGSASYAIAEMLGWKAGLYQKFQQAHGFYGVITIATLFGLMINFIGIPPFKLLYYTAILNGIIAPPLLILILLIANNKNIMGQYTNGKLSNMLGITITIIMISAALSLGVSMFV